VAEELRAYFAADGTVITRQTSAFRHVPTSVLGDVAAPESSELTRLASRGGDGWL
jgi:hypothetical protein